MSNHVSLIITSGKMYVADCSRGALRNTLGSNSDWHYVSSQTCSISLCGSGAGGGGGGGMVYHVVKTGVFG